MNSSGFSGRITVAIQRVITGFCNGHLFASTVRNERARDCILIITIPPVFVMAQ